MVALRCGVGEAFRARLPNPTGLMAGRIPALSSGFQDALDEQVGIEPLDRAGRHRP